jgi:hypothetical protein
MARQKLKREDCGKKEGSGDVLSTDSYKAKTMRKEVKEKYKGLIITTSVQTTQFNIF